MGSAKLPLKMPLTKMIAIPNQNCSSMIIPLQFAPQAALTPTLLPPRYDLQKPRLYSYSLSFATPSH
jgi:hypothetical protein